MILRGKFCAEGDSRFALDYLPPNDLHIRFADGYLNVTGGDGNTQVVEIGSAVRRAQSAFSRESSIANLKKNFAITVEEHPGGYELKFVPRSETFRRRLNYLVVTLDKQQFLPRRIEVDGKSGINSVFTIEMTAVNTTLPPKTFEVYRPK
jgi:outer membrane lipoprotein-sorting protein